VIQNLLSMLGGIVLLIGILFALGIWFKSRIEAKITPLVKQLESQTGIDLPDFSRSTSSVKSVDSDNPRLDALKDAEALLSHFEDNKNAAGQSAMQAVVQALFTKPQ